MKRLFTTLFALSLLSAFSVSAFAEGVNHVNTDGAICGEREAGKNVNTEASGNDSSNGSSVQDN